MSIESLQSEIELVLAKTSLSWPVGVAAITDFFRGLHEVMTKSGRDQANLLAQVQTVFGSTTMHHLAHILESDTRGLASDRVLEDCPLKSRVNRLCCERGIEEKNGLQLLAHILKTVDEERVDTQGNVESAPVMVYFAIGGEAAYHLGGLYVDDLSDVVGTSLCGYLDPQLRRFNKIVEMWELELAWDKENSE